jgi:hypothetical protein
VPTARRAAVALLVLLTLLVPAVARPEPAAAAEDGWYRINVWRKASQWYQVDYNSSLALKTFACYEYVYGEDAFLQVAGGRPTTIVFRNGSGSECSVRGLYRFEQPLTDADWRWLEQHG